MGFLDKFAFPNQAFYNVIVHEGGGKCNGSAEVTLQKAGKDQGDLTQKMTWEWYKKVGFKCETQRT